MNDDSSSNMGTVESEELPYEVHRSPELGRYLVAVRDIKAREIIIREDPLLSGPSDRGPKDIPVCLGCSCVMYEVPSNRCTTCHWPVCNADCEKLAAHSSNECKIFQRNHVTYPPPYGWPLLGRTIFILRCLLLKTKGTKSPQWELLMSMSDNGEVRRCKPNCITSDKKIWENFKKFYPPNEVTDTGGGERDVSEAEVIRVSGIIDTNAHSFPLKVDGVKTATVCNLYSRTSLMAHSCTPNASWAPDKSLSSLALVIRSNVPIAKGSMISVAYDEGQLLVCTLKRLVPNELNGMFVCKCERCLDPTELGTFMGALKCPQCEQGYLLPIDPVDSFSEWKCDSFNRVRNESGNPDTGVRKGESQSCNQVLDDESIVEIIGDAESMCGYTKMNLGSVSPPKSGSEEDDDDPSEDETLELLKEFVKEYAGIILHPNHYILQEVNVRILRREYEKGLCLFSHTDLIFFLERCERLLGIADILTPGFCEYRAFLQFHFSQGLLNLERRKEPNQGVKKHQRKNKRHSRNVPVTLNEGEKEEGGKRDHNKNCDGCDVLDESEGKQDDHHLHQEEDTVNDVNCREDCACGNKNSHIATTTTVNSSERTTSSVKMKEYSPDINFKNHSRNLRRIKEMLTFLLTFFEELNPSHKLLEPIKETLLEAEEMSLKVAES